ARRGRRVSPIVPPRIALVHREAHMSLSSPVVHDVDSWDRAVSRFADLQKRRAALEAEELRLLADAVDMIRDAEAAYRGRAHGDRSIPLRSLVADLAVATGLSEWTVKRALG